MSQVDVTTIEPVTAFCSSDEEDDTDALLYLPISPEIEEPEDGWGPEGAPMEDLKRPGDGKENASPKKKRAKTYDVSLENAPLGGTSHSNKGIPVFEKSSTIAKRINERID